MTNPLLATKLHTPRPQPNVVARPRLIERMNDGWRRPLTLVSAPAGYGKTTLIGEWIAASRRPQEVAWLSLDEKDNELARFWSYVFAALDRVQAGASETAITQLHSAPPGTTARGTRPEASEPIESALTLLVNALAARPGDCVLVLDDYHVIDTPAIHASLRFFLEHLPSQVHLVISTRTDPPLPLVRLRARSQLVELRAADLRLTPDEAAEFLRHVMRLPLTEPDVDALEARTEGWIAGLQLAAVSMQGRDDLAGFIAAFTGSNRYVFDYLVEEILQRQSESVVSFLLQTCILDRMCAPLCDALLAPPAVAGSQTMLETLERANLFTIPLDEERQWYRYHRLFADFLRNRLRQVQPGRIADLHRRAAEWYERNDSVSEAVDHALAAQDFPHAGQLIEQTAETILMRSDADTLLQWLDILPETLVHSRPRLCVYHALALLIRGQLDAVEPHLDDAERNIPPNTLSDANDDVRGLIDGIRAMGAVYQGDLERAATLASEAVQHFTTQNLFLRSLGLWLIGLAHYLNGDTEASQQALLECLALCDATGNSFAALLSVHILGYLQAVQGRLSQASATYQRGLEFVRLAQHRHQVMPAAGLVYGGMGDILREQNDFPAAERYLTTSLQVSSKWKNAEWTLDACLSLARLKLGQGKIAEAQELVSQTRQAMGHSTLLWHAILVETLQTQVWLAQGNLARAIEWATLKGFAYLRADDPKWVDVRLLATATLARILIRQGEFGQALELLHTLVDAAKAHRWMGIQIEGLTLQAIALDGQGGHAQAIAVLGQAISLAEPEGYVRVFVDEGERMQKMICDFKVEIENQVAGMPDEHTRRLSAYTVALVAAFQSGAAPLNGGTGLRPPSTPLTAPLSDREIEVLKLVAAGLANREVAAKLVITVGTVKRHVNNILSKLQASNRTEAVDHARKLGLL